MKYFTHNNRTKILLSLALGLLFFNVFGEGTKQTAPSSSDEVSLCVHNSTYGNFARYNSSDEERLYIRIQNPNSEKIYLGFSRGKSTPTGYELNSTFRIMDPNGVVRYSQTLDNTTSNITGSNNTQKWTKAVNGPNGIDGTSNGYNAFVFDPSGLSAGDYWVEFDRSGWRNEVHYNYYDITVASGTTSIEGRVWSKRWAFSLPDVSTDFNGSFYVFAPDHGSTTGDVTQDGFVTKIDFINAGFRPWYFNVSFNSTGTGNTGNSQQDRKSVWNALSTEPEYEVFLTDPDISVWQNGSYDDRIIINEMTRCGVDESCINVEVYATGDVEVLLDFHGNDGVYTAGTADRIIVQNINPAPGETPPFAVCVPWDGLDGLGNLVGVNANVPVVVTFAQAAFHFPVYDVEENEHGYTASSVRPTPPVGYELKFYWDDSNIAWSSGTGSPNVNLTGCTPSGGCHTWNGFNSGANGTPQYGNKNTINTWWYANRDQASDNLNMPDYIYAVGPPDPIYVSPSNPIQLDGYFQWANDGQYGTQVFWITSGDGTFSENPSASCTYTPGTNDISLGYVDISFIPDPDENCITPTYTFRMYFCTLDASVTTEDVSCYGATDGLITVNASNGTSPYEYSLDGGAYQTSNIFDNLSAGTYEITVKDANDCTVTVSDIVISEAESNLEVSISDQTNVSCNGGNDGSATASASGGTVPYSYSWDTNPVQTTATATSLAADDYTVTATDANGCTDTEVVTITQPDELTCSVVQDSPVTINGASDGVATVTPVGGTAPYTYLWDNGETTQTAIALNAGSHSVTVTDANDCTTSCSVTITEPDVLTCSVDLVSNVLCNGESNGSATVNPVGGVGPYTYLWDNLETTQTASALDAGLHSVTVTDANDATTSCDITITQPDELTCSVVQDSPVTINGASDGVATVTPVGGTAPYTYLWDNGETTQTAVALNAGSHSVTVTDDNGCTTSCSVTITEPDVLTCSVDLVSNVLCNGESNGSATVNPVGGVGPYTYLWDNLETTQTASALDAGLHSVTVTDANDATTSCDITITQPDELTCSVVQDSPVTINGGSDGVATVTPVGGTAPYTYLWDNGETTQTAVALNAGSHSVTVTDANDCTTSCSVTITEPDVLTCSVDLVSNVLCNGESNGSATVNPVGGVGPYTYLWDNLETTQTASALDAGLHSVTVTDANDATTSCDITITQPDELTCSVVQDSPVTINGASDGVATVTPVGGTAPYTYLWDNGETTQTAIALNAGSHSVTVTDANDCTTSCSVTITEPDVLTCSVDLVSNVLCNGESNGSATVNPVGGVGPYTYLWDNLETTQTASALDAGLHSVTVTDANDATTSCDITITQPDELTCSVVQDSPVTINGGSDGVATVTPVGGTAPYTYLWDNGETTQTAIALNAGSHSVTVTDANDCTTSCSVTITEPDVLTCSVDLVSNVLCNGESNGSATVNPVGGVGPYTYLWDNLETTQTASALDAGLHSVTVTDANDATTSCDITITQPDELTCSVVQDSPVTINGGSDGVATVTPVGGTAPYTYLWDNGETTQTAVALNAGSHSVTVTDDNGCTTSCSVTITEPDVLTCSVDLVSNVLCNGESNGSATVNPVGGVGPYTYLWDNLETTQTASALDAGLHSVTVTDANDATTSCDITITQPDELTCSVVQDSPVTINGGSDGVATVTPVGGTAPYTYLWDNGETTQTAIALNAGSHSVTVTDANDCTTSCSVTITEPDVLTCSVDLVSNVLCNGESNGSATVNPVGGVGPYTYLWDNLETTQTASALDAGLHSVTVTDANDATTSCDITITQPDELTCSVVQDSPVTINGGSDGVATVTPVGGTSPYTYLWDNGETTQTAIALNAGSHSVTVTDANDCTTSCSVTITEPDMLTCSVDLVSNVLCNGESNGSATVNPVGGVGPYTYLWDNLETTQTASALDAGLHSVTVTDANDATTSCDITITQPDELTCSVVQDSPVTINGGSDGVATVTPVGGTAPYTYLWDNGETTQTAIALNAGSHSVTVTDANDCTTSCSVTITEPDVLTCSVDLVSNVLCNGESNGSATVNPVGGVGPYTYLWDNLETTQTASALDAGLHSVTVTDANDATTSCDITITQPDELTCSVVQDSPVTINGGSDGVATVTPVGGTSPYTYLWDNGETTQTAVALNAGSHSVTVTDDNGCTTSCSVTITEPDVLTCSVDLVSNVLCNGESNGSATVNPVGGVGPYTYLWDNGETTQTAVALNAGSHSVTVTDANDATTSCSITITQPDELIASITDQTNVSCYGGSDGSATVSAEGGTEPYSYLWNDGQTTATAIGLVAGTYTVTVTDAHGCYDETTVTITEPDQIFVDAGEDAEICETNTYTLQGSAANYDHVEWSGGTGTFSDVNDLNAVYTPGDGETGAVVLTLTAYGIGDCEDAQDHMILTINPAPTVDAGEDAEICETASYILQGSATNYDYVEWSGGAGSFSDINDLNAVYTPGADETGTIILTLKAYGSGVCSGEIAEDNMTLTITPAPIADAGPDAETCEMTAYTITEASAENYSSISWTHNGLGNISGANSLSPTYMPAVGETGNITLTLTVYGNGSCEEVSDEMILTIIAAPIADAGPDAETCEMIAFTVTDASASNYSSVLWTHNGTGSLSDANTLTPTYTPGIGETGQVVLTLTVNGTGSCGADEDSMILNITPMPIVDAGPDAEVCENGEYILQGTASNYSYVEWSGGSGTFSDVNDLNAVYTSGTGETGNIILTLTAYGNGSCEEVFDEMTLSITPAPIVDAGPDAEVCETGVYTLQGSASNYSYVEWSGGSGSFSDVNDLDAVYTPGDGETGDIVLTLTAYGDGSCGEVSDDITLTITAQPIVDAGPDGQTCEGVNFEVTGASVSNYESIQWTTDGLGILYNASTINPIYAPAEGESGVITLTLTAYGNGSCGEASDEMTLTIIGAPTAYAGPDEQTCQNMPFTITEATAENYTTISWTHNGIGTLADANTLTPTYTPADGETGEVTLVLTVHGSAYCGDATDEMTLTIISPSYVYAGVDAVTCETESYELVDAIADNYVSLLWTTSGDGEFSNVNALNPTYYPGTADVDAGNVILTLTAEGAGPCEDVSDEMTLSFNLTPEVFAGEDGSMCQGDTYELANATAFDYSSLLWTTSGDGVFNDETLLKPIYTPGIADIAAGSVVLSITAYSGTSCPDVTDEMTLFITLQPDVFAGEDAMTCNSYGYTLEDATADMYESLLWTTSGDGEFNDATILNPVYTPGSIDMEEGSVILTITAFGSGSCEDASDEMILEIIPEPTAYAGEDAELCASDLSFEITSSTASNYISIVWTTSGDGSFNDNTILNPVYTAGASDTEVTLTLTAVAAGSCEDASDEMVLMINENPVANAGNDQTIPIGTNTILQGSATGGSGLYAYYWSPEELLLNPNEQNPTTVNLNDNPTMFILQVTDGMSGCYDYDTVLVILENIPEDIVVAVDDYDTTYQNTPKAINILANDSYPSEDIPNITICDEPDNGMVTINDDGTLTYTPNENFTGDDMLCYKICDAEFTNLCDSAMVYIHIGVDDLIFYNTMTPNGDGVNDKWIIKGIERYLDNKVYLFNRWGDEIKVLERYDNSSVYWDGKNRHNKVLPDGTYYYVFYINIDGVERTFTGWVFMHGAHQ